MNVACLAATADTAASPVAATARFPSSAADEKTCQEKKEAGKARRERREKKQKQAEKQEKQRSRIE